MSKATTVRDLMSAAVQTCRPELPLAVARTILGQEGISALPVASGDGRLLGLITATDLIAERAARCTVRDVMAEHVITVPLDARPAEAARLMRDHGIHHLVCVDDAMRIAGVLSSFDLLEVLAPEPGPAAGRTGPEDLAPDVPTHNPSRRPVCGPAD